MCGIAGFIDGAQSAGASEERRALLERMCRVIEHRGPDDEGTMVRGRAALGMRRLSIIDLKGGHQPISNEDGSIWVVFNGEIYNYRDLQRELEARGHKFQTNSDTETIVHAYEEYGERFEQFVRAKVENQSEQEQPGVAERVTTRGSPALFFFRLFERLP